jgi:hypothetical protein
MVTTKSTKFLCEVRAPSYCQQVKRGEKKNSPLIYTDFPRAGTDFSFQNLLVSENPRKSVDEIS